MNSNFENILSGPISTHYECFLENSNVPDSYVKYSLSQALVFVNGLIESMCLHSGVPTFSYTMDDYYNYRYNVREVVKLGKFATSVMVGSRRYNFDTEKYWGPGKNHVYRIIHMMQADYIQRRLAYKFPEALVILKVISFIRLRDVMLFQRRDGHDVFSRMIINEIDNFDIYTFDSCVYSEFLILSRGIEVSKRIKNYYAAYEIGGGNDIVHILNMNN